MDVPSRSCRSVFWPNVTDLLRDVHCLALDRMGVRVSNESGCASREDALPGAISETCLWCGQSLEGRSSFEGLMCLRCVPALLTDIHDRLESLRPAASRGAVARGAPLLRLVGSRD